jgi:polyhydroxybutyrate depolymerase
VNVAAAGHQSAALVFLSDHCAMTGSFRLMSAALGVLIVFAAVSGCASRDGRFIEENLVHDGRERTYLVHLPPGYDGSAPVPMVIVLHGGGGNPRNADEMSRMSEKADREGFIAVYPAGTGALPGRLLTWNGGFCCGYAMQHDVDDVGFISALIDGMIADYGVDPARVYVTGISNGGIMSYRLAAELPDKIAAIAPVAGSAGGQSGEGSGMIINRPDGPVSVIAFHGTADARVPYEGGRPAYERSKGAYSYLSVNGSAMLWVEANNCTAAPRVTMEGNLTWTTYAGGDNGTEVVVCRIGGGEHSWPGGRRGYIGGDDPFEDLSANDAMWEFFEGHPKQII